jgi:hypothetical protein
LQFIAVVANCNAKRVPRPLHCSAVHCNEPCAIAAPLQSPQAPRLLRTRVGHCILGWAEAQVYPVPSRAISTLRTSSLCPARAARRHHGHGSAAGDVVAKVARSLPNCANVRGATANLRLTFRLDHSVGADQTLACGHHEDRTPTHSPRRAAGALCGLGRHLRRR